MRTPSRGAAPRTERTGCPVDPRPVPHPPRDHDPDDHRRARRATPQWTGAVAAPGTVVYTGTDTTTAQALRAAWGVAHAAGALPGGVLTGAVTTGHDDQGGFPAVGPPRGTPNLRGHGANVAWVTGTAPWPGGARGFRALLARLTTGWVLVTWTWTGGTA